MNINKTTIIIAIPILFILGSFFVWMIFFKSAGPVNQTQSQLDSAERVPNFKQGEAESSEISTTDEELTTPVLPIPKPESKPQFVEVLPPEQAEPFLSFFGDIREAVENVEAALSEKEPAVPPQSDTSTSILQDTKSTTTKEGIVISMTDDEFHYLYPDSFISSLMEAQNFLKEYDSTYGPITKIETDEQVRFIQEKAVEGLLSANMITKEEAERYITTIRFTLPQLQLTELWLREMEGLDINEINKIDSPKMCFLPENSLSVKTGTKGLFLAGLLEKFFNTLAPTADAKVCGYCYILPECYMQGAASPGGIDVFKAFCYCTGCLYGQGCLDFCSYKAAIWDPLSGICGCG